METTTDYLVIGAGPAGLQLGYFLAKAGRQYLILEEGDRPGIFFEKYPRHRQLLSINKVHTGYDDPYLNLRWDWNSLLNERTDLQFKRYSKKFFPNADDLVLYLRDFAVKYDLNIEYRTKVDRIGKENGRFRVTDEAGRVYLGRNLIVATGVSKPHVPDIPGIHLAENYTDVSIDPEDFINQRVLIVGKGNSGFETAENLVETAASLHLLSPHNLKMAWKSHHVGHLRAVNNNLLDTYLLKTQNGLLEATIQNIEKREDGKFEVGILFTRAHGAKATYVYDRLILCTGFRIDDSIFDESCKPELAINNRFPAQTSKWESVNVPGMYFAGTLMQARDYKKTQSSFIHGFRYNVRALHQILEIENHGGAWPGESLDLTAPDMAELILDRINRSAGLWHQPGFLCDLLVIDEDAAKGAYYHEVPRDYLQDGGFGNLDEHYCISLEYGPDHPEFPFEFNRYAEQKYAHLNPQLHPVIRRYRGSELIAEHHVLEELEGHWVGEIYTKPLLTFLDAQLAPASV